MCPFKHRAFNVPSCRCGPAPRRFHTLRQSAIPIYWSRHTTLKLTELTKTNYEEWEEWESGSAPPTEGKRLTCRECPPPFAIGHMLC